MLSRTTPSAHLRAGKSAPDARYVGQAPDREDLTMSRVAPSQTMPDIEVDLVSGGRWKLSDHAPKFLLMVDVYRGLHCPRCRRHLESVSEAAGEFAALGIDVIAISADPKDRAEETRATWDVGNLQIGYGLDIGLARRLGLYVSTPIRDTETERFAEPGVFLVRPDLTLYGAVINSFPFVRPAVSDLLEVAMIVKERNYPPRGTQAA
jgi:alkyl hydroperoxide reductase subunit AhpC